MSKMIGRRGFITGLVSLVAAPAIVRAGSLMPVKAMFDVTPVRYLGFEIITTTKWSEAVEYKLADMIRYRMQWKGELMDFYCRGVR